jgi:hypothetical protein
MLISTALLLDSIIRNSVCTPAKLPCRRVEVGYVNKVKSAVAKYSRYEIQRIKAMNASNMIKKYLYNNFKQIWALLSTKDQ